MADNTPSVADPGPLGLAGFALTTFVLSVFNAGLLDGKLQGVVLPLALFYGGIVQLLAGMWEFKRNNLFGAVAFTSYGAFWLAFWYLIEHASTILVGTDANKAVGLFLLAWTIITVILLIGTTGTNGFLVALFAVLTVTFIFLTVGNFANSTGIIKIGGYFGLITAVIAWYGVLANVFNATHGKTVLPLFAFKK
ncbi:MAG: acetate uptake transporter [Actinomycetota bacterium]|nr:acetate uptake transporter [Actinomycetota bacterium]